MHCPNCNGDTVILMVSEQLPCSDCGGKITLNHYLCPSCKYAWRTCDDDVIDGLTMELDDVDAFIDTIQPIINELTTDNDQMVDILHHCLRCGNLAYQSGDNSYVCSECGFEWEIV